MHTLTARKGGFLLVVTLFLVSILLEQAIAGFCPWLGQLGGVRPSIVFLDIPLEAPVTIDWMPVGFIFLLFYGLVGGGRAEERPKGEARVRGWAILGRWWLLLIFLLIGGGLFYLVDDYLPKAVRNGIDSFGMRADLILPYPSGETVHLQGSMIILAFFILGWRLLVNTAAPRHATPDGGVGEELKTVGSALETGCRQRIGLVQAVGSRQPATLPKTAALSSKTVPRPQPAPAPAVAGNSGLGRIIMRIPEPVEIKSPGGRPCVYVSMPAGLQRKRSSYPCVVDGGVRPKSAEPKK